MKKEVCMYKNKKFEIFYFTRNIFFFLLLTIVNEVIIVNIKCFKINTIKNFKKYELFLLLY